MLAAAPPRPRRIWSACCAPSASWDDARPGQPRTACRLLTWGSRTAQPLYDLAPLARLMGMGLVMALGPLAWVWLRNRGAARRRRRLQALTLLTLFLTFDLVLFGAFTRLTDSGLGCPDWPGCYGKASPWARAQTSPPRKAPCPPARSRTARPGWR
jgi:heme A synthase